MKLRKYTEQQLRDAIQDSLSLRQVLSKLGIIAAGGNYQTLNKAIKCFNIDTKHFTGQLWNKGKILPPVRKIEDYLSNKYPINSSKLRRKLIREDILKPVCMSCNLDTWLGEPIPLELDHIDGNHSNNNLSNLRILCPNCHAKTPTYCRQKYQKP